MKCIVKDGCELAHGGTVLTGGATVDLPAAIALEVRHLVVEVLPSGDVQPIGAADRAEAELADALERAKPHERISILEQARADAQRFVSGAQEKVAQLDRQIAAERKASAKAGAPTGDPAGPKPDAVKGDK